MPSVATKSAAVNKSNGAVASAGVKVNFAGVNPATGGGSQPLPVGKVFKVKVTECKQDFKKDGSGKITYPFRFEVIAPESMAGRTAMKTMTDINNEKAKAFWATALLSCGVKREILEKGSFVFRPEMLNGKVAYIFTGAPQAGQKWPNVEFILPEVGEKRLKAQGAVQDDPAAADAGNGSGAVEETTTEPAAESDDNLFS